MHNKKAVYYNLKPEFHFSPGKNWINDPNGPVFFNGEYHIFFQYNPDEPLWGNIHWGHATSSDMIHWTVREPAIEPGPEEYDKKGVYSGSSIQKDNSLYLFYTAASPQSQCLAKGVFSSDENSFLKHPDNPLIPSPPKGFDTPDFRDPFVWKDGDIFQMLVASSLKGDGIIFLYSSHDLISWEYIGEFFREKLPKGAPSFECPLYFKFGNHDFLVISPYGVPFYLTGFIENNMFIEESRGIFDPNPNWYAPNTFVTPDGRRILVAWIKEEWPEYYQKQAGWSGALSIFREIIILESGALGIRPVAEMNLLRISGRSVNSVIIQKTNNFEIPDVPASGEIELALSVDDSTEFEIALFKGSNRNHVFLIKIHNGTVTLSDNLTPAKTGIKIPPKKGKFEKKDNHINIRIFLDRSIIEIFVNESLGISSRLYSFSTAQNKVFLIAHTGEIFLKSGTVYQYRQNVIKTDNN